TQKATTRICQENGEQIDRHDGRQTDSQRPPGFDRQSCSNRNQDHKPIGVFVGIAPNSDPDGPALAKNVVNVMMDRADSRNEPTNDQCHQSCPEPGWSSDGVLNDNVDKNNLCEVRCALERKPGPECTEGRNKT